MRTATLTISIDIDEEDGTHDERPDDLWCAELLLEVVASQTDQALMGYITITEIEGDGESEGGCGDPTCCPDSYPTKEES